LKSRVTWTADADDAYNDLFKSDAWCLLQRDVKFLHDLVIFATFSACNSSIVGHSECALAKQQNIDDAKIEVAAVGW
jgi:hypothetical protein